MWYSSFTDFRMIKIRLSRQTYGSDRYMSLSIFQLKNHILKTFTSCNKCFATTTSSIREAQMNSRMTSLFLFFDENQTLYLLFRFRNGPIFCWRGNQSTMEASNEFVLTLNFFGFQMLFCITGQFASLTTKFYRDQKFSFGWFPCSELGWRGWKRYVAPAVASSAHTRF